MSTQQPEGADSVDDTIVRSAIKDEPQPKKQKKSRAGRILGITVGMLLVLVAGIYAAGYVLAGDKLPRSAQISGVAVGGLDRAAAIEKLTSAIAPQAEGPIAVTIDDQKDEVKPAEAGLRVDYAKSIDQAGAGKSLDPRHIWRVLTGGTAADAIVDVDNALLKAAVSALAKEHDATVKDATLAFEGAKVVRTKSTGALTLDQSAAVSSLKDAYFVSTSPVALKAATAEPEITTKEVDQVVDSFAKRAVSAPVTVKVDQSGQFEVTPAMIGHSVTFEAKDGTLVPKLDTKKLRDNADAALKKVELRKPKDAAVRLVDGEPKVTAAVNGTEMSEENLAKAVEPALTKSGAERTVTVELTGAKATFTTEDAEKLGVKEVTGEFTTYFPYANYRNVNIGRAAELINGTVLKPDDTFSLNGIVGERTAGNGFIEGNIISGGKFRLELGGGVSQSATTTYNAMFFAGLKDIQHQPHTLFIDRYPPGREATVAWPSVDLKFQNDTKYGVLVQAFVNRASPGNQGSITVKMWSTKTYDKIASSDLNRSNYTTGRDLDDDSPKCQQMSPVRGFDVNYSRLFYSGGKVVKTENFFWRYAPTDRVNCT